MAFGIRLRPDRRAHEGKPRRQRSRLALYCAEIGSRERLRVGIGRIRSGEDIKNEREVGKRAGECADMIERARERQYARARNETMARFYGEHAAKGCRANDRA